MKSKLLFCLTTIFAFLAACSAVEAQSSRDQIPYYSEYYFSFPIYNPAFAGELEQPGLGITSRFGKGDYGSKPFNINAFVHGKISRFNSGLGFALSYNNYDDDYYDPERKYFQMGALYSWGITFGEKGLFKVGLNAGLLHFRSQNSISNPSNEKKLKPNFDFGILLRYENFYAAFSSLHTNQPSFKYGLTTTFRANPVIAAGYTIAIQDRFFIRPHLIYNPYGKRTRSQNTTTGQEIKVNNSYVDFGLLFDYNHIVFAGFHYKLTENLKDDNTITPIGTLQNAVYRMAVSTGFRIADTYQLSFAYHVLRKDYRQLDYNRFEVSAGFYFQKDEGGLWEEEGEEGVQRF